MRIATRVCALSLTLFLLALVTAGCSGTTVAGPLASSSFAAEQSTQARKDALLDYVEAERAAVPAIQELFPGVYSNVRVEATLEEQRGDRGVPAGTYAVAWFYYTYKSEMNWSQTVASLDALRPRIDAFCQTHVFPAMRAAGITGKMGVAYNYDDGRSEFGPMWSHACSKWD